MTGHSDFGVVVHQALAQLETAANAVDLQTQFPPNIWRHIETFVRSEVGQWALVARQTRLELSVHATLGHT